MTKVITFNGIKFLNLSARDFPNIINKKGLFVFPAAPALINIEKDRIYKNALKNSDIVFFDSGYFVILLLLKGIIVKKFSGLKFFDLFINYNQIKKNKIFLIDPDFKNSKINKKLFNQNGFKNIKNYVAPVYNKNFNDQKLLNKIIKFKPRYIFINLGGGIQEKLGLFLKIKLSKLTTIICTGAAISFFTGQQARIPYYIDKIYLGWLFRILYNPKIFLKRYLNAFKFFKIFFKHMDNISFNDKV
jgi:N-acetylglucosaminyldiphosphoundecaprenol N-acetyl-beta-D-mannosaminyltransferase